MKSMMRALIKHCMAALLLTSCVGAMAIAATNDPRTQSTFTYISYIKTTPEALWKTLTTPEDMKQYWGGLTIGTDWKVGSPWKLQLPDGQVVDAGEILDFSPPTHLVLKWRNEINPARKAEGFSRCSYDLEKVPGGVKLTVTHQIDHPHSKFIEEVAGGWPFVVSNIKSLLETGNVVSKETDRH
jgi:uncharacterized protein YndB with AHSA1/START domain